MGYGIKSSDKNLTKPRMILPDLKHALARGKTQQMLSSRHMFHVPLAKHWGFSTVFDPGQNISAFAARIAITWHYINPLARNSIQVHKQNSPIRLLTDLLQQGELISLFPCLIDKISQDLCIRGTTQMKKIDCSRM